MRRRKRSVSTRFSLFSFQDIITCVMGIMLLLTLLICLQITNTQSRSASEVQTRSRQLQSTISEMQSRLAELESRVSRNTAVLQSGGLSNVDLLRQRQEAAAAAKAVAQRELFDLLSQSKAAAESLTDLQSSTESRQQRTVQEIAALTEQAERARRALKQIQDGERVVYNRYQGSAKSCWIVEISSDSDFKAAPIGEQRPPVSFSSMDQTLNWIRARHREGAEFLLLLKPNADKAIDRIPGTLREEGIMHAYDLLGQDQTALDPQTGAELL